MRKIALALATGAAFMAGTAVEAKPKLTGEEQLAKILEGREAGKPVNCISLFPTNADDLDSDDVLVSDIRTSQVCHLDVVRMHDRSGFWYNGFVGLEQFEPYRKVASAN
jgi:hypothetical protein